MTLLRSFAFALVVFFCVPPVQTQSVQAEPDVKTVELTFTTIDVPGAVNTFVYGINSAGDMTGDFTDAPGAPSRGFRLVGGNVTKFDYPGGNDTVAIGINDSGVISGSAFVRNYTAIVSFLYDGTSFSTFRAPGKIFTIANGINNAGMIVGGYGSQAGTQGFARIGTRFKTIAPPGEYANVSARGINNFNQIVGSADGTGFFYGRGKFKVLTVPGATETAPAGINDNRAIVGSYFSNRDGFSGFVLFQGDYMRIAYPGASSTFAAGLNNAGQIVGSYTMDYQTYHGFVTSPISAADFQ
jgi:uncharacterized membrane protein